MAMGYFKKQNLATCLFLVGFLITINCTNFTKEKGNFNKPTNTIMNHNIKLPKFDIENYESNLRIDPSYEGYQKDKNTFVKQFHTIKDGYVEKEYTKSVVNNYVEEIEKKDQRTRDVFTFDITGNLQSVRHYFAFNLEIGEWKFYENNSLVSTIDKDENYLFSLKEVIKFGKAYDVDFLKTGVLSRSNSSQYGGSVWDLTWNTGVKSVGDGKSIFKNIILNGETGKVLFEKEYSINPLGR